MEKINNGTMENIPDTCLETTGPILFVAHQPSFKIILDSTEWNKTLFHVSLGN